MVQRRRKIVAYAHVIGILFFFLAPIIPMRVAYAAVLPTYNQCVVPSYSDELARGRIVYASPSYAIIAFSALGSPMIGGTLGLLYVPNLPYTPYNDAPAFQFPPLGFNHYCPVSPN